jgi:hypothetical protein
MRGRGGKRKGAAACHDPRAILAARPTEPEAVTHGRREDDPGINDSKGLQGGKFPSGVPAAVGYRSVFEVQLIHINNAINHARKRI